MDKETLENLEKLGITQEMLAQAGREIERDTLYALYQKFQEMRNLLGSEGRYLSLVIKTPDDGDVRDDHGEWITGWHTAERGIERLDAEIARIKAEQVEQEA